LPSVAHSSKYDKNVTSKHRLDVPLVQPLGELDKTYASFLIPAFYVKT